MGKQLLLEARQRCREVSLLTHIATDEFLKEHRKVEKLEATVASLAATVKEQAAEIQKVSAQLELNKPAPQTVKNNQ